MQSLNNIQALIIDMDGVLWKGNQALPGLVQFFTLLRKKQLPFILATNNATLTQAQYIAKLETMGVTVYPEEILTSSMATAHYLSEQTEPSNKSIFVIGEEGLRLPLIAEGFTVLETFVDKKTAADYVVSGLDRQLSWKKLADASLHLQAGAKFIATNADTSLPTEQGDLPGNGAIIAALTAATHIPATVIGKPEPIMYKHAIEILKAKPENTIAIGDRLNTDILGAVNTGIRSIMVLSGISTEDDIAVLDYQPTWIMPDISAITKAFEQSII